MSQLLVKLQRDDGKTVNQALKDAAQKEKLLVPEALLKRRLDFLRAEYGRLDERPRPRRGGA